MLDFIRYYQAWSNELRTMKKEDREKWIFRYAVAFLIILFIHLFVFKMYRYLFFFFIAIFISFFWLVLGTVIFYKIRPLIHTRVKGIDEKGEFIIDKPDGSYADFMDDDQIKNSDAYEVKELEDDNEILYGQLDESTGGEETVFFTKYKEGAPGNRHHIFMGISGDGKDYVLLWNNILKAIERKESFVVIDPASQAYNNTSVFAEDNGYKTKVINFKNKHKSNSYNILEEVLDDKSGRISIDRLNKWMNILKTNTQVEKNYWFGLAVSLISFLVSFAAYIRESEIMNNYQSLYLSYSRREDEIYDTMINSFVPFPWAERRIRDIAKDDPDIEEKIAACRVSSNGFNIDVVYRMLQSVKETISFAQASKIPKWHPAYDKFIAYQNNVGGDAAFQGSISNAQQIFEIFNDPETRNLLSKPDIHLKDLTSELTGFYIISDTTSDVFTPIMSILMSFIIMDVDEAWDKANQARLAGKDEKRLRLCMFMNEFSSLGVLGGDPEWLTRTMDNIRKAEIDMFLVMQQIAGFYSRYGEGYANGIISDIATIVCIGVNDPKTKEFIMSRLNKTERAQLNHRNESTMLSIKEKDLMSGSDLDLMRNRVLVMRHGSQPLKIKPITWDENPMKKKVRVRSILEHVSDEDEDLFSYFNVLEPVQEIKPAVHATAEPAPEKGGQAEQKKPEPTAQQNSDNFFAAITSKPNKTDPSSEKEDREIHPLEPETIAPIKTRQVNIKKKKKKAESLLDNNEAGEAPFDDIGLF